MQPRAEEIHRVLSNYLNSKRSGEGEALARRSFSLVVQGSTPLVAEIRELRELCAMIDIGSSIFTLAYSDIMGIDPIPAAEGSLRMTVRPGCFASHAAARLRRSAPRPWRGDQPAEGSAASRSSANRVRRREAGSFVNGEMDGGIAEGDPADTGSAEQEVVLDDAGRSRR